MTSADTDGPLTAHQISLLATPDEVLRKSAYVFSFDKNRLATRINEDVWPSIIQAHLYFDHVVTRILSENVPRPDALDLERIGFSQKIDLMTALGLGHESLSNFLRKLNVLRNKISHDLDFEITEADIRALRSTLNRQLNDHISKDPLNGTGWRIEKCLIITIILLEIHRQRIKGEKLVGEKVAAELHWVAEECRSGEKFGYVKVP